MRRPPHALPLGLVDGEAIGSAPPQSSGTAAGVLNFLRLGSEAVVIGAYAAALSALIKGKISDTETAQDVAAGIPGQAAAYADSLHPVIWAIIALSTITAVVIGLLHRARLKSDARDPLMATV